jgi:hypothetical protein
MKADKAIRMLKTVDAVSVNHSQFPETVPTLAPVGDITNNGWSVVSATTGPTYSLMICEWEDTIDIAGLAANDISLINAGGAVARPSSPYSLLDSDCVVSQMTLVSVNPIELTADNLPLANALSQEGNLQDYFLATTQEFQKAADSVYIFSKSGEHNFGTGGIAQATKLYVKSFVWAFSARPIGLSGTVAIPPCTIAVAGITADLDPVQMAAAIYRANDQE